MKLPKWLRRDKLALPDWATRAPTRKGLALCLDVDTREAFAEWVRLLEVKQLDQYWLEVIYQCVKLDLQASLVGTEYDPRVSGQSVEFRFSRVEALAQNLYPKGRGAELATKGKEARGHYIRIRGSLPF